MITNNCITKSGQLYATFCETIEKYGLLDGIDRIIFLFSGGKDATLGLYYLNEYVIENKLPISVEALMIAYPTHVYYHKDSREASCFVNTKNFWENSGVKFHIFDSEAADFDETEKNACKICKAARKKLVDGFLNTCENKERTAIVTGYTLYDAMAYMDEIILVSNFEFDNIDNEKALNRMKNCFHKMKIKEKLPNGFTIIRPLINMKENFIMQDVIDLEIPYISRGCKASVNKHKREYFKVLNVAEPINNTTYEGLLSFINKMDLKLPETFDDINMDNYFTDC